MMLLFWMPVWVSFPKQVNRKANVEAQQPSNNQAAQWRHSWSGNESLDFSVPVARVQRPKEHRDLNQSLLYCFMPSDSSRLSDRVGLRFCLKGYQVTKRCQPLPLDSSLEPDLVEIRRHVSHFILTQSWGFFLGVMQCLTPRLTSLMTCLHRLYRP